MRSLLLIRSCVCLAFALAVSAGGATLRNGQVVLSVDGTDGHLAELRRPDGPNLLSEVKDGGLWRLSVRRPDGTQTILDPDHAKSFAAKSSRKGLRLRWTDVQAEGQPDRLDVAVTIKPTAAGKTEWRIEVDGKGTGALWKVDFPRVCGLRSLGTSRLAVPLYIGRVVTNPAVNGYTLTLGYPQPASMQCFAFWTHDRGDGKPAASSGNETGWLPDESTSEGLYLAAEDGAGHLKQFTVKADRGNATLNWWVEQIPSLDTWPLPKDGKPRRMRYESPYPVVLAPYVGDMQEAAVLYRDWAKDQVWCQRGKQEDWPAEVKPGSKDEALWTPPWFRQIACWLKYYHEPAKILPEFAAYQEWLNVPMASHWYRFDISKFDDNYNEMLPGDPYLLQGIQDAKAMGVQPLPYINGVIWDTDTESWHRENGLAAAVKDEGGEFVPWDIHGEIFAHMCPVEQWRAKMREVVRKLVGEHGMSGVYLDCLAATRTMPCYDPTHGHPIRGGKYRSDGNRKLMYDLRADARSYAPEACFFTEEIGEAFVDVMDGFLTLDYLRSYCRSGERVFPFFSLVYHPYTINFGSDAAIGQDPDAFRLQMGTLYAWGSQPLLSSQIAQPPKKGDPTSEFLRELVQHFDFFSKPYLTGAEWVPMSTRTPGSPASKRPIDLLVAEHRVEYGKMRKSQRVWTGPAVLASAWKRGDSLAVTMINITGQDQPVTLTVADRVTVDAKGRRPATDGLFAEAHGPDAHAGMRIIPKTGVSVTETDTSLTMEFTVPAGGALTYVVRGSLSYGGAFGIPEKPGKLVVAKDGEFQPIDYCGWPVTARGATLTCEDEGKGHQIRAFKRQPDGSLVPCRGTTAGKTGPRAEGHGLPRRESERPFLILRGNGLRYPFLGTEEGGAIRSKVHAHGQSFTLASVFSGDSGLPLIMETPQAIMKAPQVVTDLATGAVICPLGHAREGDYPGAGELLYGTIGHLGRESGLQICSIPGAPLNLPRGLRVAGYRLLRNPSDKTLGAVSKALYKACLDSRQDPKPFVADRPLMQVMERLHALLCARTAMLPLVEIKDDWLSPGVAKTIRVTPAPGYPDRKPDSIEVVPVGDWGKGMVTVTSEVREADKANNTHTFTLTLRDGLYVERMVPVLFFLKVTRGEHEFYIPEIVRLEANRPVHLIKPRGVAHAVVGRESQATFTLRNWSPHPFTASLQVSGKGFTTKLETGTVECPPLADTPVTVRFIADPGTRPGARRIQLKVKWADVSEATVTGYAAVDLREALVPVTDATEWAPTPEGKRATFRRRGWMVVSAQVGETIRATIKNVRVTRYVDSCVATLHDVDGKLVWKKTIRVDQEAKLAWKVKTAGAHTLELLPKSGSAVVEMENRVVGETASKHSPLDLFFSPLERVFYVPKGAQEFRFRSRDGGMDETGAIRITSPTGRVVLDRGLYVASPALATAIQVKPDEAGKLWHLKITPRQDISLWLEGDVCPVLSDSPARAMRGRE